MEFRVIRHHFPEIDSTNTWAKKHISSFDRKCLTVVSADQQTNGRGRMGRHWVSPAGNLYVSFCFFWQGENVLNIPQLMALTIVELLSEWGINAKMKWPNDILVDNRKIAGVLCETVICGDLKGVVLGVGLNINLSKKELAAIDQPCCSLKSLGVEGKNPQKILDLLIEKFGAAIAQLKGMKGLFFLERYKQKLIHNKGDLLKGGTYEGIDDNGFLLIRKSTGSIIRIASVIDE